MSSCDVNALDQEKIHVLTRAQRTIGKSVSLSGKGVFSGCSVTLKFIPAQEDTGIRFRRVDLPGKPLIKASVDHIVATPRCTILGRGDSIIQSVEHVLSALRAFDIDNVIIEIDGPEIPIGDGSALLFTRVLETAGISSQEMFVESYVLKKPVYWSQGNVHLVGLPAKELRFSYTLSYPNHPLLNAQFYTFVMDELRFIEEIAPCRTFALYEEVVALIDKGIIKGGTLENGVIIKDREILNKDGLRFPDEMVRHKILDLIGDISLVGFPVIAHFIAIRSGHYANTELAKMIVEAAAEENLDVIE